MTKVKSFIVQALVLKGFVITLDEENGQRLTCPPKTHSYGRAHLLRNTENYVKKWEATTLGIMTLSITKLGITVLRVMINCDA
jgi:hypothetical protein